jgi:lysophospholipid acyltransferase (LPLAT)-like uncharacterized protein
MGSFNKGMRSSGLTGLLAYLIIRVYTWTFRLRIDGEAEWKERVRQGEPVLLVAWHQQFFSAIRHFKTYTSYQPSLMISRSKDGDLIAGVANRTGWYTARGSSSKGGKAALDEMIDRLKEHHLAAHVVDGPKGPAGRIKAGAIRLAHAASATIVPLYVTADRAWYFRSWDRFFIPKPFARVTIRFGEPIELVPTKGKQAFEEQRLMVEDVMRREGGYA